MSKHNNVTGQTTRGEGDISAAAPSFEPTYPSITRWVKSYGWVEIGQLDSYSASMARALDEGGLVWEGEAEYAALDDLLRDLEAGLSGWFAENVKQETP